MLNFGKKYSKQALEECCSQALALNKATYTFIRNTISSIAAEMMTDADRRHLNEEKNRGAYVMGAQAADLNHLLAKSRALLDGVQEGGEE